MTDPHTLHEALTDAHILLNRAWAGQDLTAFGADGAGLHGRCATPQTYRVTDVGVSLLNAHAGAPPVARASLRLAGYVATAHGLVFTDRNAAIWLRHRLAVIGSDPDCWYWAPVDDQGLVSLEVLVLVDKLLA